MSTSFRRGIHMTAFPIRATAGAAILALSSSGIMLSQPGNARADQVILDDLIVDGSICAGFDCVNGESFGFDTLRLKENNLRIRAQDTSSSASFPTRDWQITFNDTTNGGAEKFSIDDIDGGRTPFTIRAGARNNSLFVDSSGRVGLGTATPVVRFHMVDGNTPTMRLEQDGSAGFTPQTWDVAGNEANFFVRDVTNGSKLSFKIFPNAPTNSLIVEGSTGDVGVGIQSPTAPLHIRRTDGTSKLLVEDSNSGSSFRTMFELNNAGTGGIAYRMTTNGLSIDTNNTAGVYRINFSDGDNQELELDGNGNLIIDGEITTSGSCSGGCDLVFDPDYKLPTIDEQAKAMWENRYLPNVGPTPESGPFNLSQKVGGILNELEKAHIYIGQLNEQNKRMSDRIAQMDARLEEMQVDRATAGN
jgi:hypothetical protein